MTPCLIANSLVYDIYPPFLSFTSHTELGHMLPFFLPPDTSFSPFLSLAPSPQSLMSCMDVHVWPHAKLPHTAPWTLWASNPPLPLSSSSPSSVSLTVRLYERNLILSPFPCACIFRCTNIKTNKVRVLVNEIKRGLVVKDGWGQGADFKAPEGPLVTRSSSFMMMQRKGGMREETMTGKQAISFM